MENPVFLQRLGIANQLIKGVTYDGPNRADQPDIGDVPIIIPGGMALDVGGGDGRYSGLIRAFGADRVVVVDPDGERVRAGIAAGNIEPEDGFVGTMQDWPATKPELAQAAFAINLQPELASRLDFWAAALGSLALGGLLVVSASEAGTGAAGLYTAAKNRADAHV